MKNLEIWNKKMNKTIVDEGDKPAEPVEHQENLLIIQVR